MDATPSAVTGPFCLICRQPLFGRTIWTKETGNCHDSCVVEAILDEVESRWMQTTEEA